MHQAFLQQVELGNHVRKSVQKLRSILVKHLGLLGVVKQESCQGPILVHRRGVAGAVVLCLEPAGVLAVGAEGFCNVSDQAPLARTGQLRQRGHVAQRHLVLFEHGVVFVAADKGLEQIGGRVVEHHGHPVDKRVAGTDQAVNRAQLLRERVRHGPHAVVLGCDGTRIEKRRHDPIEPRPGDCDNSTSFFSKHNYMHYLSRIAALTLVFASTCSGAQNATTTAAAKEEGAVLSSTGLVYRALKVGTGASPKASDTVKVHYRSTLPDGKEFDSSYKRGEPIEFPLGRVIACWTEGVQRMKVGGKAKLTCPPQIAYGERGAGGVIPPNATLLFEVELLGINGK